MKKRVTLKFKLIVLIIVLACCGITFINQSIVASSQEETVLLKEQELADSQYENNYLQNALEYINSDEYIEQAAREKLGWVKKGERIYIAAEE